MSHTHQSLFFLLGKSNSHQKFSLSTSILTITDQPYANININRSSNTCNQTRNVMASQAEPQSQPSIILPPLLALPVELKLKILSNFSDHASDPGHALTLMILRRTHKSFRLIIPNPWRDIRATEEHFLAAERQHSYLLPFECRCHPTCTSQHCPEPRYSFFPCYDCKKLVRRRWFCNYRIAYFRDDTPWDLLGAENAQDRICDSCWDDRVWWMTHPGASQAIYLNEYPSDEALYYSD